MFPKNKKREVCPPFFSFCKKKKTKKGQRDPRCGERERQLEAQRERERENVLNVFPPVRMESPPGASHDRRPSAHATLEFVPFV